MEPRLIKPEIIYYKKISYIKSYWWLLLFLVVWFVASQYIAINYTAEVGDALLFIATTAGVAPLVAVPMIHYSIIYERKRKESWAEYKRWENEPEIVAQLKEAYRDDEIFCSAYRIISDIKNLEKYIDNKEMFIIQENRTTDNYVIVKMTDEEIKNNVNIDIQKKHRTTLHRL